MADNTPMMKQYLEIKEQNKDCILFFRLGDFYEMFNEDALIASKELDIALTTRDRTKEDPDERTPMCGVPYHSSESYIARLIAKGYKVAICEQTEDPSQAKGLVRREVVRTITPGTVIDSSMLEAGRNNYICCVTGDGEGYGLCFIDISTGEAYATFSGQREHIINELGRFSPAEAALDSFAMAAEDIADALKNRLGCRVEPLQQTAQETAQEYIAAHFGDILLPEPQVSAAVGGLLAYLHDSQKNDLSHIKRLEYYVSGKFMELDIGARRNLELTETLRSKEKKGTLLWVLDHTKTPMGGRLLRSWLEKPLLSPVDILKRSAAVEELYSKEVTRAELMLKLRQVTDLERLIGRIVYGTANCRDLVSLASAASALPQVLELTQGLESRRLRELVERADPLADLKELIDSAVVDEPPITVREGGMIRDGYNPQVDSLREIMSGGKGSIASIEAAEREKTGIPKLKVGYNRVFGYYLEVSRSMADKIPDYYIRKQTLANTERYITPELKELESTILTAGDRITALEYELFNQLRTIIADHVSRVQATAAAIAELDVLCSLAEAASKYNYCRPVVDASGTIDIRDGRHPVVERVLTDGLFVPNDTALDGINDRVEIITGPNMAGKSTYMRQVALIVLMAQIGSFVPARSARIGVVDRIFTRIGASDDLASGQSTFMVEMNEVAEILKSATSRSLLILDEIGRGTSTFDGMAIARAVVEHATSKLAAKTLFATHYHELTCLEQELKGVKNYNIAAKKRGDDIIFLRKIVRGGADESYGIEVAKLAGVPASVVKRARQLLSELEGGEKAPTLGKRAVSAQPEQVSFADLGQSELVIRLQGCDLNTITPIEAMNLLFELKKLAGE